MKVYYSYFSNTFVNLSASEQVCVMRRLIKKQANGKYLRTVYILVDEAGYSNIQARDEKQEWREIDKNPRSQCKTTIELIGDKTGRLNEAEKAIKHLLKKTKEGEQKQDGQAITPLSSGGILTSEKDNYASQGARPKTSNTVAQVPPSGPSTQNVVGNVDIGDEGFDEDEMFSSVSAVINQGIINYKQETNDLGAWIIDIQKTLKVNISQLNDKRFQVEGSFREILRFQEYLDNEFLVDLDISSTKDSDLSENDVHKTSTDSVTNPYPCNSNQASENTKRTVVVKLCTGDLTEVKADCIAVSNQPRLPNKFGLAQKIATLAGHNFQSECKQSVKEKGELQVSECRVTSSGYLKNCHAVAHICVPYFQRKRDEQTQLLIQLEKAIVHCFEEVDKNNFATLAMPCIGSGSPKFPPDICAQQYVKALKSFFIKTRNIKEVIFVDISDKQECLQEIHKLLCKYQPEQIQYSKLLYVEDYYSNDGSNENPSRSMSDSAVVNASQGYNSGVDVKYWQSNTSENVKLYVCSADITATVVDAVVSPEDSQFKGEGSIARKLLQLGGDSYKRCHSVLDPSKYLQATQVTIGSINCKYVLHAVSPHWNKEYSRQPRQFEKDTQKLMREILTEANRMCESVAIPLLGTGDSKEGMHTPVETCCRAMINGIEEYMTSSAWKQIHRIEICCTDAAVLSAFKDDLGSRSHQWKGVTE